jgi:ABC-type uncharacterized transport system permease subunit
VDWVVNLLDATLRLGGPLALTAMAGLISERSGVINIGLEGKMLGAAGAGAMVSLATGSPALGLAAGLTAGVLLAMLHAMSVLAFRIDHVVSGMAVNAVAYGITGFAAKVLANRGVDAQFLPLPQQFFVAMALAAPFFVWWWLRSTSPGLRLDAVGNDPHKAEEMGVNPQLLRLKAQVFVGLLAGLAGVMLVSQPAQFSSGMTAGRGFIALAALILGGWRPLPVMLAAYSFGLFDALQLRLQGQAIGGLMVPSEFWASLPYLLTLVALAGFLGRSRPPAALGRD